MNVMYEYDMCVQKRNLQTNQKRRNGDPSCFGDVDRQKVFPEKFGRKTPARVKAGKKLTGVSGEADNSTKPVHAAAIPRGDCIATRDGSSPPAPQTLPSKSAKKRAKRRRAIAKSAQGLEAVQGVGENPRASAALTQPAATRPWAKTAPSVEAHEEPDPHQFKELRRLQANVFAQSQRRS
jgi:hypothetical protein